MAFLAFVHLALFLALSLSPGNSLVSSRCDHSMLASLLWRCLTVPSTPALLRTHSFVFFSVHETRRIFLSSFISYRSNSNLTGPIRSHKRQQKHESTTADGPRDALFQARRAVHVQMWTLSTTNWPGSFVAKRRPSQELSTYSDRRRSSVYRRLLSVPLCRA